MARIAGVNIPTNKRVIIALTYIHGIGRTTAVQIADKLGIPHTARVQDLTDEEVLRIRETIDADHQVEGDLRREAAACVTAMACPFAVSAPTPMPAPVRVRPSRSQARRSKRGFYPTLFPSSFNYKDTRTWHANPVR